MRLLAGLLVVLDLGCAGIPRPVGEECFVNQRSRYKLCFDLAKDYDSAGQLKQGVRGVRRPVELQGHACYDPETRASIMAFARKMADRLKQCEAK